MPHLADYQRNYTDLRMGKLSFNDFMSILEQAYARGAESGSFPAFQAATPQDEHHDISHLWYGAHLGANSDD